MLLSVRNLSRSYAAACTGAIATKESVSEAACIQIPWPHAKPPYRGAPSQAQPNPQAHPSLPAGAQVTPATSRAQQPPQLAAQASMAMEMQVKHEVANLMFEVVIFIVEVAILIQP